MRTKQQSCKKLTAREKKVILEAAIKDIFDRAPENPKMALSLFVHVASRVIGAKVSRHMVRIALNDHRINGETIGKKKIFIRLSEASKLSTPI